MNEDVHCVWGGGGAVTLVTVSCRLTALVSGVLERVLVSLLSC